LAGAVACVGLAGCLFDPAGATLNGEPDSKVQPDGAPDSTFDGPPPLDADFDANVDADISCVNGDFTCTPEGGQTCVNGSWQSVGKCLLGCEANNRQCHIASNVDEDALPFDRNALRDTTLPTDSVVHIDTDSGRIYDLTHDRVVRRSKVGVVSEGIGYYTQPQPDDAPPLGIFLFSDLAIPASTQVRAEGTHALVMISLHDVDVEGIIDAGALGRAAGPGGFTGGAADEAGLGACGGQPGEGVAGCNRLCAAGSGGGGFGGAGGNGGNVNCYVFDTSGDATAYFSGMGGAGGATCGNATLIPLMGGSGGAGGVTADVTSGLRGAGGGGGGGLQIAARRSITIGLQGGIWVPGGGGGFTLSGGGSGGGAGGALLLEAQNVVLNTTSFLAVNGGGGGGGD
jgi:hypothetical protein